MKILKHVKDNLIIAFWFLLFVVLLFTSSMMLQGCEDKCETLTTYTVMEPVFMTTDEVREGFRIEEPHHLESSGKIYVFGNYLLINEPAKGIHIIENINCTPKPLYFIAIPGNFDMAVKDFILYADSYIDLLAIDISNLPQIELLKRVENAFPLYNNNWGVSTSFESVVVTHWEEKQIVDIQNDCTTNSGGIFFENDLLFMSVNASSAQKASYSSPQGITGVAGSMARFAIHEDYLYAVDNSTLRVFDIEIMDNPNATNSVDIGWGIETIFPFKDHLFIGSTTGMFIFNNSNPASPVLQSQFVHVNSCDPVVVDDSYAYVTLRSGNECAGFTNQLDVLDITDLSSPKLVKSYPMQNPHGLSIDGDLLFITEGEFGMKLFDATERLNITNNKLDEITNVHGFDIIAFGQKAIMIGEDGLYLYNYIDPTNLQTCGFIAIGEK